MSVSPIRYELIRQCPSTGARLGRVHTPHGVFDTPAFMPVGTQGTLKGVVPHLVAEIGAQCILANTYHLMLRPGEKTVAALGYLHRFMSWQGPILTDSGGFQVFSLSDINKIDDDGVTFKSHVDGAMVRLTPERSMEIQNHLGADIIMAFDECPPGAAPRDVHEAALARTLAWIKRCTSSHSRPDVQGLFGIVQGGTFEDLRYRCAQELIGLDLPGYAVGGLAVGEGFEAMKRVLGFTTPLLPASKPRYLMGVGFPIDIAAAVATGIDMFDCTMPTRNGRNAYAFSSGGPVRIKNSRFTTETGPLEAGCDCLACRSFTCGAIRHFFFAGEMLGPILVSLHNLRFFQRFMADIRSAIGGGWFADFLQNDPRCRLGAAGAPDGKSR